MNKETFNKKIKITILSSAHYEGFSYNSILYTPPNFISLSKDSKSLFKFSKFISVYPRVYNILAIEFTPQLKCPPFSKFEFILIGLLNFIYVLLLSLLFI